MTLGPSAAYDTADDLLDCIMAKLAELELELPCRKAVVPGEIVWDTCANGGQLYASIVDMYYSNTFPIDIANDVTISSNCAPGMVASNITIGLMRCAPAIKGNPPRPPTIEEYQASALAINKDNYAIRSGLICCLGEMKRNREITDWRMGRAVTAGPEGGCVGTVITVTLGFVNA